MSSDTCVLFSFQLSYEFSFCSSKLRCRVQSSGHVYDDDVLVREHDRSKKANLFENNPVLQSIVSACARKYFMETQPSSLNLAFFILQLRQ